MGRGLEQQAVGAGRPEEVQESFASGRGAQNRWRLAIKRDHPISRHAYDRRAICDCVCRSLPIAPVARCESLPRRDPHRLRGRVDRCLRRAVRGINDHDCHGAISHVQKGAGGERRRATDGRMDADGIGPNVTEEMFRRDVFGRVLDGGLIGQSFGADSAAVGQ